jgi:phospholipid/cholesterol/gamma-HCH transport system substrate-binding protein
LTKFGVHDWKVKGISMEPKVNYVLVGGFVMLFGAFGIGIVLWLGKTDYRGSYDRYQAYMRESVAGLSVDSTVKYRGVDVGRVKDIALSPETPEEVVLTLDILHGTPIKTDTIAMLEMQGLTGIATLNLTGGSRDAALLQAQPGQEHPVIKTGPSLFFRFDEALSKLLADQPITQLMESLTKLTSEARTVVGDENRAAMKQILADLADVTKVLAARSVQVDQGILNAARAAEHLARMTKTMSEQLPQLLERANKSAAALQAMAEDLAKTSHTVGTVVTDARPNIEQFSRETLVQTGQLVTELRELTATLNRVAQEIEREPNALVLGRGRKAKGPGE